MRGDDNKNEQNDSGLVDGGMISLEEAPLRVLDLRTYVFSNSTPIITMRIIHQPTGVTVEGKGNGQYRLRRLLMAELECKVKKYKDNK